MKSSLRQTQSGVVLIIALIVLVAMTLAALALVRSVDTNNLIAGNMAFQQAAVHSADAAIENAAKWLNGAASTTLENNLTGNAFYNAAGSNSVPDLSTNPPQTWDAYWNATLSSRAFQNTQVDSAGNTWAYVIDRLCTSTGSRTGGASCVGSPQVTTTPVNQKTSGAQLNGSSAVFYRITVRVTGPKNTVSYVQSILAL